MFGSVADSTVAYRAGEMAQFITDGSRVRVVRAFETDILGSRRIARPGLLLQFMEDKNCLWVNGENDALDRTRNSDLRGPLGTAQLADAWSSCVDDNSWRLHSAAREQQ